MEPTLTATGQYNAVAEMKFHTIRPISRGSLPLRQGRGRDTRIQNLQVVKDFRALLDYVVKDNINPFEVVGEIDTSYLEIQREISRRKSFPQAFRKILCECLKLKGLEKAIEIIGFDRGKRLFIVGRATAGAIA
jgi:hypothetical protein